jgi:hypothetical protein
MKRSRGILNLCHRDSDEAPRPFRPAERYTVRLALDYMAYRFRAGNRIRVSVSTTYWPLVIPSPEAVRLTLFAGACHLILPTRQPRAEDSELYAFGPPYMPPIPVSIVSAEPGSRTVEWDVASHRQIINTRWDRVSLNSMLSRLGS